MAANPRTNTMRSEHYGQLQRVIDAVFADGRKFVRRLDVVVVAESCPTTLTRSSACCRRPRSRVSACATS